MDDRSSPTLRTCTRCRQTHPATAEYFWRHKQQPSGWDTRCKPCSRLRTREPDLDRFNRHVAPPDENGCTLFLRGHGIYGYFTIRGVRMPASRARWTLVNGAIPDGFYVCHRCDVPRCVNPDHLFLGTASDNMQDASAKGRIRAPRGEDHMRSKLTDDQVRQLRSRYEQGETIAALAKAYGIADSTAGYITSNRTWKHLPACAPTNNLMRGEAHYLSKMTAAGVQDIRRRVAAGETQAALALEYGIHKMSVNAIVHRRAWRSIP